MRARQQDMLAAFRVEAVGVGAVGRGGDADVQELQILRKIGMQIPAGAVAEGQALDGHALAMVEEEHPGPPRTALDAMVEPPVRLVRLAVQHALADERHVRDVHAGDEGGEGIQRVALPGTEVVIIGLVGGKGHAGQDGELRPVGIQQERCAFLDLHRDVALQEDGQHRIRACRDQHAALLRAAVDSRLDGSGIFMHAVTHRTEAADVQRVALLFRAERDCADDLIRIQELHLIFRIRPQPVDGMHHRIRRAVRCAVHEDAISLPGVVQSAVGNFEGHAAGGHEQLLDFKHALLLTAPANTRCRP